MIRPLIVLAALAAALLAAPAAAQNGVRMPTQELLVRQFQAVAFSNEYGGAHRFGRLVRWTQPIRVKVTGVNASAFLPEVNRHLATLRRLVGVPIEVASDWQVWAQPNLEVVFTSGPINPAAACRTEFLDGNFAATGYTITRVKVVIPAGDPALRRHCIVEELTQAMGLGDDSQLIADSIFDDNSRAQKLWPWDELMLLTLYDRRLRPGMSVSEAMPAVRMIVSERVNEYLLTHE